jgi:hypothetical protein
MRITTVGIACRMVRTQKRRLPNRGGGLGFFFGTW